MRVMVRALGAGRVVDLVALRGVFAAHVAIGRCPCRGRMHVTAIEPPARGHPRWWVEVQCDQCARVAAVPGTIADPDVVALGTG